MRYFVILVGIVVALSFSGCGDVDEGVGERLDRAEALAGTNPDSALRILGELSRDSIKSESLKARYALVVTHARFKLTGMAVKDSAINVAVDYFRKTDDAGKLALALLYQCNMFLNNRSGDAMLNLLEAERLLDNSDDSYAKGLYYFHLGALYQNNFNYPKAAEAYRQSNVLFGKDKSAILMSAATKLFEGTLYADMSLNDKAIDTLNDAIKTAEEAELQGLAMLSKCNLFILYVITKQVDKAMALEPEIKEMKLGNNLHSKIYGALSWLYYYNKDDSNGEKYCDMAWKYAKSAGDSAVVSGFMTDVANLKGDYKKAYTLSQQTKELSKEMLAKRLQRPMLASQRDYLKNELELNKQIQTAERQRNVVLLIAVVILLTSIIVYLRNLNKRKQRQLDEYVDVVLELEAAMKENNSEASELIQMLYKDQFAVLNGISDAFAIHGNDVKGQKYVYNEVKRFIEQFSSDKKTLQDLENTVNKCCDNVMRKLREELPTLDELDYRQLCYHYARFSGKLIGVLMGKSQANIYMRKSRLKDKIEQSDIKSKEDILRYLA